LCPLNNANNTLTTLGGNLHDYNSMSPSYEFSIRCNKYKCLSKSNEVTSLTQHNRKDKSLWHINVIGKT
jgi:hypothetical protein